MGNCAKDKFDALDFFTQHAEVRMNSRCISVSDVETVIAYGRRSYTRGAVIYVIGVKEVKQYRVLGINLDHCEGIHAVCSSDDSVITVYRNHDLRGLKPKSRRHWHKKACHENRFNLAA